MPPACWRTTTALLAWRLISCRLSSRGWCKLLARDAVHRETGGDRDPRPSIHVVPVLRPHTRHAGFAVRDDSQRDLRYAASGAPHACAWPGPALVPAVPRLHGLTAAWRPGHFIRLRETGRQAAAGACAELAAPPGHLACAFAPGRHPTWNVRRDSSVLADRHGHVGGQLRRHLHAQ